MWAKYWKDVRIIRNKPDKVIVEKYVIELWETLLILDIPYFWRLFWIAKFRSYEGKKNLLRKEVKRGTLEDYKLWLMELEKAWWITKAIVHNWKRCFSFERIKQKMQLILQKTKVTRRKLSCFCDNFWYKIFMYG